MNNIFVFVAHSDDHIIGAGGTIAKYSREGFESHTVICSFGESTHPHLKPEVIRKTRVKEAKKADKLVGGKHVSFLGLRELKFLEDAYKNNELIVKNLAKKLQKLKPKKIFTHHPDDNHPDHKAAYKILLDALKRSRIKTEIYSFMVWKFMAPKNNPKLYVDISEDFYKKIEALHEFKSQFNALSYVQFNNILYLTVYIKAIISGLKKRVKYAEAFDRMWKDEKITHNN